MPGQLAVWWLGQHSLVLKAGQIVRYMDPFLSPLKSRAVPPLLRPDQGRHAALVFGSHDNTNHIDRAVWPAIASASPQARFVVPDLLLPALADDLGIDRTRFVGLDDGQVAEVGGVSITAIAAALQSKSRRCTFSNVNAELCRSDRAP